jgi:YVTN family beta-propeller protein
MTLLILIALISLAAPPRAVTPYLRPPALTEYARHDPSGTTILPNGRFLRPSGRHLAVAQNPHGLAISRDGSRLFVASEGIGTLVDNPFGADQRVRQLAPMVGDTTRKSNGGGCAFSPNGKTLWWSSGETGAVYAFDTETAAKTAEVSLNVPIGGREYKDSFVMDLALSADGGTAYCADVTNFRVAVIDCAAKRVVGSVAVGRYPYALGLDGSDLWVTNIGMFEYSAIPKPTDGKSDPRGLTYPSFGYPSKEARDGVEVEGRKVPGLGEPNVPEAFSAWCIDARSASAPQVTARVKTGLLVGAPSTNGKTVGGSAPNFVLARRGSVWVSNGNNDMVERLDPRTGRVVAKMRIVPSPLAERLRGVGPAGMDLSPDGKRLYVAESGINAIAVMDARSLRVLGHIPTAWYPYRVAVMPSGRALAVICFKGFGNGPSAGQNRPTDPFMGMRGVLTLVTTPPDASLPILTKRMRECNGLVDRSSERAALASPIVPGVPGAPSPQIKHVVFITKENHTYDAIFDRIPGANDDPSLLRWGLKQKITGPGQPTLESAAVMTNHNALARQFTVSDNFYMEPEASGVGHRWLVGVQPNNFCQMTYTLGWDFSAASTAPGRRASFGSNGSIAPEDYPEAGSMWEHLARNGVRFRNYGEGFEFAGVGEDEDEAPTGAREVVNIPMSKVLFDNTCREFPIFNMNIPDQYRADWFIKDFSKLFLGPSAAPMPSFVNIAICNDHGAGPNPDKGFPYLASWMADNDLALGRIVEFLSATPYWKNMLILVTQDDAGGEPDHIDAQRSVLLAISPWVKRGYVSHRHTTIPSMHRTLYEILGLPQLNMFDGLANNFSDCFTTEPSFAPYKAEAVDPRIFDPAKARDARDPEFRKALRSSSVRLDDPAEVERVARDGATQSTAIR